MKLFILGASGGCGAHAVRLAQERGHVVSAVVRPSSSYAPPAGVRLVKGDPLEDAVLDHMRGHDAVVSCLGVRRANPRNPFSPIVGRRDFNAAVAKKIVAAMRRTGVTKIVGISAAGVGNSAPGLNRVMRFFLRFSDIGVAYQDLAAAEDVFRASGLVWAMPRPTALTTNPYSGETKIIAEFPMSASIGRANVAGWMLDCVEKNLFDPPTPIIADV